MPIKEKSAALDVETTEEYIEAFPVATYTATGRGAENAARKYLFDWANKQGINLSGEQVRIFATYNSDRIGKSDFCYKLSIKVPENITSMDDKVKIEVFSGGRYLSKRVKYRTNAASWYNFIHEIEQSREYSFGPQSFMEEYLIQNPVINRDTEVIQHMPIQRKESI